MGTVSQSTPVNVYNIHTDYIQSAEYMILMYGS